MKLVNHLGKTAVVCAGVMAFAVAGSVDAGGKGPRASVSSATVCKVEIYDSYGVLDPRLIVETRVRDKSSGEVIPGVRKVTIEAVQKLRQNVTEVFETQMQSFNPAVALVNPMFTHSEEFSLCDLDGNVDAIKGLNANATVEYQNSADPPDTQKYRSVSNRCSDDPYTWEIEPSGIKIDDVPGLRDAIALACP